MSTGSVKNGWETVKKQANNKQNKQIQANNKPSDDQRNKIMPTYDIPVSGNTTFQMFMDKEIRKEEIKLAKKEAIAKNQIKQRKPTADNKIENNKDKKKATNDSGKNLKAKQSDKSNHVGNSSSKDTPKGLENALKSLTKEKVDSVIEQTTSHFSGSPIVWLLDISSFLNSRISQDSQDATFSGKPHDYPLSMVRKDVQESLLNLVKKCNQSIIQQFHSECIKEMVTNVQKNHPASGYRIMIQIIAIAYPQLCPISSTKFHEYVKSFGHDDRIISTILWSAVQPGYYSLNTGIKTWVELFKPLVAHKFFGKMAMESLQKIIESHSKEKTIKYPVDPDDFIQLMELAFSLESNKNASTSRKLAREVMTEYLGLRNLIYKNQDKTVKLFFPAFLAQLRPNISTALRDQICTNLVKCLNAANHCYSVWRQIYKNNLNPSTTLLDYLLDNFDKKQAKISNPKVFKETLKSFCSINNELVSSNKAPKCISKLDVLATKLLTKTPQMKSKKKTSSLGDIFIVTITIGLLIFIDCQMNGSFKRSKTYQLLDKIHAIEYTEIAWKNYGHPYYVKASPYLELGWNKFSETATNLWEKCGPVREWTMKNLPPAIKFLETKVLPKIVEHVQEAIAIGSRAFAVAQHYSIEYGTKAASWLEENVFTGSLSKENIVSYAKNATQSIGHYINEVYLLALSKYKQISA